MPATHWATHDRAVRPLGDDEPLGQHRLVKVPAEEARPSELLRREPRFVHEQETEADAHEREQKRIALGVAERAQDRAGARGSDRAPSSGDTGRLEVDLFGGPTVAARVDPGDERAGLAVLRRVVETHRSASRVR